MGPHFLHDSLYEGLELTVGNLDFKCKIACASRPPNPSTDSFSSYSSSILLGQLQSMEAII